MLDRTIITLLLTTVVFTALAHGAVEPWSVAVFEVMVILLMLLWTAKAVVEKRLIISVPKTGWPVAALVGVGLIQSIALRGPDGSTRSLSMDVEATRSIVLLLFLLFIAFLAAANFISDSESAAADQTPTANRLRAFANFMAIYGLCAAAFALIQHFTWNGKFYWIRPNTADVTAFGPFVNHNHYAGYVELLIGIPLALALTRAIRSETRMLYGFAAALMAVSAIVSLSRGGIIALVLELLFIGVVGARPWSGASERSAWGGGRLPAFPSFVSRYLAVPIFLLAIGAGVIWIGAEPVINRITDHHISAGANRPKESFFASRGWIWRDTIAMIGAHPVTGVGLGAFNTAFSNYSGSDGALEVGQAHNDYLQVMADFGIVGAGLLVWFLVLMAGAIRRGIQSPDPLKSGIALGSGASIVGILVHSFFDFNLQLPSNALLFLILVAVVSQVGETKSDNSHL